MRQWLHRIVRRMSIAFGLLFVLAGGGCELATDAGVVHGQRKWGCRTTRSRHPDPIRTRRVASARAGE